MEFKREEIENFLKEAEELTKETLEKIKQFEQTQDKVDEAGIMQNLLYELGYRTGHENTLRAIIKLHS